ncbi:N-acetylmuramoyl-L-alanine amidase [Marinilactibacillus psychrotolerans]|uniref:N-acetylmuramoyl-L-alanine amidase n=1 Tax=Marinilactibacillus psychrotolerans TaxID=191770 RepID=UPI00388A387A
MTTVLFIAGHGKRKDGSFDPGATGLIEKGEHRYMKEDLFPAMKKQLPKGANVVFFSAYNVLSHGNIVSLAKKYGSDTIVAEAHFDALGNSPQARGGHVIVWHEFKADSVDLSLRDAIEGQVGVRYTHMGDKGISGRNLGNARLCAAGGINYRLLELGFGTNAEDVKVMVDNVDEYARVILEAVLNTKLDKINKPAEVKPIKPEVPERERSIEQMAEEVRAGDHGNGHKNRQESLGVSDSVYQQVRERVNELEGLVTPTKKPTSKTIDQMAEEVREGKHGTGHVNRQKSLGISAQEYEKVRNRVNELEGVKTVSTSSSTIKVGDRVMASRLYGSGTDTTPDRTSSITGYVDKIDNGWKNPYRLVKTKGKKDYLGFTRMSDLKK